MKLDVGAAHVECSACREVIDVPVTAELHDVAMGDGSTRQYLSCDPDMTDLWAHAWTHEQDIANGAAS